MYWLVVVGGSGGDDGRVAVAACVGFLWLLLVVVAVVVVVVMVGLLLLICWRVVSLHGHGHCALSGENRLFEAVKAAPRGESRVFEAVKRPSQQQESTPRFSVELEAGMGQGHGRAGGGGRHSWSCKWARIRVMLYRVASVASGCSHPCGCKPGVEHIHFGA